MKARQLIDRIFEGYGMPKRVVTNLGQKKLEDIKNGTVDRRDYTTAAGYDEAMAKAAKWQEGDYRTIKDVFVDNKKYCVFVRTDGTVDITDNAGNDIVDAETQNKVAKSYASSMTDVDRLEQGIEKRYKERIAREQEELKSFR